MLDAAVNAGASDDTVIGAALAINDSLIGAASFTARLMLGDRQAKGVSAWGAARADSVGTGQTRLLLRSTAPHVLAHDVLLVETGRRRIDRNPSPKEQATILCRFADLNPDEQAKLPYTNQTAGPVCNRCATDMIYWQAG